MHNVSMWNQPISNVYNMTVDDQFVSLTPTSPVKRTTAESPKGQRNKNPRNNPIAPSKSQMRSGYTHSPSKFHQSNE
jgi:hypothetical protein